MQGYVGDGYTAGKQSQTELIQFFTMDLSKFRNNSYYSHFLKRLLCCAEGLGPHCMQTTKAYRKESSGRGKGSAPGCVPKLLLGNADSAVNGGNQALCSRSFTHRCVSVGIKKDPDRVRFIRAILKSKGLSMWSCLPLCPDPGITLGLVHCRQLLYHLSHHTHTTTNSKPAKENPRLLCSSEHITVYA